jgi:hypothetical protein
MRWTGPLLTYIGKSTWTWKGAVECVEIFLSFNKKGIFLVVTKSMPLD